MVGTGNTDKLIWVGLSLAIVVHVVILSIAFDQSATNYRQSTPLTVTLNIAKPIAQSKPSQSEPVQTASKDIKKPPTTEPLTQTRINRPAVISVRPTNKSSDNEETEKRLVISPYSSEYKRFLQSKIDWDRSKGSPQQGEFANSFGPKFPVVDKPEDLNYSQGPLGGGNYKVVKNGRVRCQLQMVPLTVDDLNYAFPPMSKDCSPQESFDLKLNQPVDGNMDSP